MSIQDSIKQCRANNDYETLINSVPYAKTIGMTCNKAGEEVIYQLPAKQSNIGNPTLPAIHGGVLGGFIEQAAILHVLMRMETDHFPKVIDLAIDYLTAAQFQDCFAECRLSRMGKRVANLSVVVWQVSRSDPVATARAHLLLK